MDSFTRLAELAKKLRDLANELDAAALQAQAELAQASEGSKTIKALRELLGKV